MNKRKLKKYAKKKGLPMPLSLKGKFKDMGKFPYIKRLTGGQAKIDAKDFAVLRAEKAKGRGMGLQDEKLNPGKIYKAKRGMSFSDKMKAVEDGKINKKTGKPTSMKAMREMKGFKPGESASQFNKRKMALEVGKKALKATTIGKIALGVGAAGVAAQQYLKSKMNKKKDVEKKMGGGMMQKPMGYNTGGPSAGFKSKQDRKKAEKNIKEARGREGLRSFLSGRTNPMRKDRYMEGRKARHTEFKKKIGRRALGIASSLNPVTSAIKGIKKIVGKTNKNTAGTGGRNFQKGDYGDISVKKNMGGMMMQRPMGYKYGTSVKAKCKLGRNKATKIT